jgi:hypothetical protein
LAEKFITNKKKLEVFEEENERIKINLGQTNEKLEIKYQDDLTVIKQNQSIKEKISNINDIKDEDLRENLIEYSDIIVNLTSQIEELTKEKQFMSEKLKSFEEKERVSKKCRNC